MPETPGLRQQLEPVLRLLTEGAAAGEWRKCVVTPAKASSSHVPWQKLVAQPVRLNRGTAIKVVTQVGRNQQTNTVDLDRWPGWLEEAIEAGPCHLDVLARDHDWHARRTRDGRWLVTRSRPSLGGPPPQEAVLAGHDRIRNNPLPPANPRLVELFIETGLYGKNGKLLGEAAPKYRQVQHYIELLRHLPVWGQDGPVRVVDAGCGKAYLSLALCLWAELNGARVELTGVDSSPEVIATVERIARKTGLASAGFQASSIADFAATRATPVDVLLSLHACDTATDEALAAGVRLGAGVIVLVPCCHHEVVAQVEAQRRHGNIPAAVTWEPALKSGLLRHRLADIVTDTLRATALEALGYKVEVVEFVSPEATARNLMIRAQKLAVPGNAPGIALERYRSLAAEWAVSPALEALLGDQWPPAVT